MYDFADLVNELLVYHQTIDKLGLYLLPYHPTYVQILENKTLQNINKIDIDTLFEIISKIESVANAYVIRSAIYDNHLRDFNNWMNEDCYWLGKNLVLVMNIFQDFASKFCKILLLLLLLKIVLCHFLYN